MTRIPGTDEIPWDDPRRNITDLQVFSPDRWYGWPPGRADVQAITARATSSPRAAEVLARGIRAVEEDFAHAQEGAYTHAAVWVPDPDTGVIVGWVYVELFGDVPEHDAIGKYVEEVRKPPKVRGVKLFDYAVASADDFPPGPTAMVTRTYAERGGPVVEEMVASVVPHGGNQGVRVTFTSMDPAVSGEIVDHARVIVANMQITLGFSETAAP